MNVQATGPHYPARLEVEYAEQHDRVSTLFRIVMVIPIAIVYAVLTSEATQTAVRDSGEVVTTSSGGITGGLFVATLLMILFRKRYPRWWFDFALELARFSTRIGAYAALLRDEYPSTVEEQGVHLELDYPDVERDLNRRSQPVVALGQVALGHPSLPRPRRVVAGRAGGRRYSLVRDLVRRALSTGVVRLRGRCRPLVVARAGVCLPARHRPLPALLPEAISQRKMPG